jgi:hypothetical protein
MEKYHIALSFAGEDREYVDKVAQRLQEKGVKVFYDKFEETTLWGKDLYVYLSDVYQNQAFYTVMFISDQYRQKLWTNHERINAQARAFSESREYVLPAFFDTSIDVPGVLKTTGHVSLADLPPEEFADRIIDKLIASGIQLLSDPQFSYSDVARADVDFPIQTGDDVSEIIQAMRTYSWYTQRPAVERIFSLNWSERTPDEAFVLGRNIYQCADGGERRAQEVMKDLRRQLAKIPDEWPINLLNGMFYEVYFNREGKFRESKLKNSFLGELFALETVSRYELSINYIRQVLDPFRGSLGVLPSKIPEVLRVKVTLETTDPPTISSIEVAGKEQLIEVSEDEEDPGWRFSFRGIMLQDYPNELMKYWNIPDGHLEITYEPTLSEETKLRLAKGKSVGPLKV